MSDTTPPVPALDANMLTTPVRAATSPDAELVNWAMEPFGHSLDGAWGTSPTIFRVSGTAGTSRGTVEWALLLKVVTAPETPDDPSAPGNGAREWLAYTSGFLSTITGIRAPRCYGVTVASDGSRLLWLELVADDPPQWNRDRYGLAARHLGRFNAAFLIPSSAPSPAYDWLSRPPLREALDEFAPGLIRLDDARADPVVARAIPASAADRLRAIAARAPDWLRQLDRMPQTICHWDAHRANLLSRPTPSGVETVAVDWAGVGWGAVGTELSKCLSQTVNFFQVDPESLPALDAELFERYLEGIADQGLAVDREAVRFGHAAASAVRLVVRASSAVALALRPATRAGYEQLTGQSFSVLADRFGAALPYYLSLVEEADSLGRRSEG